jgi:vacuolar protein sorting-associated protein 13A/C
MTEQQRRELYEVLDYDEKAAIAESFELPRDALKAKIQAELKRGSFALKTDPHGVAKEIISVVFDEFQATGIQRRDNLEVLTSLGGFTVYDGTAKDTLFPQIVQVKQDSPTLRSATGHDPKDPFFYMKFENNPLDERADTALTIRMRHMEVVYHRGYVEAIYKFFKPPRDRLESVEALLVNMTLSVIFPVTYVIDRQQRVGLSKVCARKHGLALSMCCKLTKRSIYKLI